VVGIPGNVWLKAKMFDAKLKNVGHVSGTKIVTFVMDHGSRMDATLKAMKALISSCTELFPTMVESSEDGETSSSYSDLIPHDVVEIQGAAVGGGNQHVQEVDQMKDITTLTAPPISTTKVVVPNAIPISSTVGKETLDGCHVEEVTPPSLPLTFHVVVTALPPLASLAPELSRSCPLAAPLATNFAEIGDHIGVILGPNGHEVSVLTDKADRSKKRKQNKKKAKLKKRKDREYILLRFYFGLLWASS
jgi:hypothetical protein